MCIKSSKLRSQHPIWCFLTAACPIFTAGRGASEQHCAVPFEAPRRNIPFPLFPHISRTQEGLSTNSTAPRCLTPQRSVLHGSWNGSFTRNQEPWVPVDFHFLFRNTSSYPHWNVRWIHPYELSGKNILGIIHVILFKGSESWPNQTQFPLQLSKVLPNESYNPCQMSVLNL